jgi:hypothetical protein
MNSKAFYEKSPHGKKKSQLNTVATHNSAKPILMSDLFSRIGIGPPYFALQEIIATPRGTLTATAQAEYPRETERDPITAAEAGRHLAILGSSAISLKRDSTTRHFYLARKAKLTRVADILSLPSFTEFNLEACATKIEKRTATAFGKLLNPTGELLYELTVKYQILNEKLFYRMFKVSQNTTRFEVNENLYKSTFPIGNISFEGRFLSATLDPLSTAMCSWAFF